jgi:hypothetical protein
MSAPLSSFYVIDISLLLTHPRSLPLLLKDAQPKQTPPPNYKAQ